MRRFRQRRQRAASRLFFEDWSVKQEYTADYAYEIEKKPGKEFTILNLTDIQLEDYEIYGAKGKLAEDTIDKLIKDTDPDLITVTGDNAWGMISYLEVIKLLDSYGIPWAPVMGNHDGQKLFSEFWAAYYLAEAENCLFKFGPKNMGYGNYVINITENGRIIHTVYMMDTHSDATFTDENGEQVSGYDHLWDNQIEWYKWVAEGVAKQEGRKVPSSVYFHIPVYEYRLAWAEAYDTEKNEFVPEYADTSFGFNGEGVYSSPVNNGFFDVCKQYGTTDIVAGHDHTNNSSILYNGIRLTYGMKTGAGCYWDENMNGGTVLTMNSDGILETHHVFVDPDELGYSENAGVVC